MTTRREQVREAIARHRKRRKRGFFWRPILVTKAQLDQLEERGYLNPSDRGTRADECEAIARPTPPFASPSPGDCNRCDQVACALVTGI
jgi:hypothetical protein